MNGVGIEAAAKEYFGKTVKATKINGGKHLEFNNKSALLKERGITDMWCYSRPETGDPMLYLEDAKGNLIREFNLKKQFEQVKNYFMKINKVQTTNKAEISENELYRTIKNNLKYIPDPNPVHDRDIRPNSFYEFNGRRYDNFEDAANAFLENNPNLKSLWNKFHYWK